MTTHIDHNPEDLARLGREFLRSRMFKAEDHGKFIAIAVDDDDFEIHADDYTAVSRLIARHPGVICWLGRIGYPTAHRFRIIQ